MPFFISQPTKQLNARPNKPTLTEFPTPVLLVLKQEGVTRKFGKHSWAGGCGVVTLRFHTYCLISSHNNL